MRAIFVSYRRDDTPGEAGCLFDDLVGEFGDRSLFMDVAAIEAGRDFRKVIDESVATCGMLLAIIGLSSHPSSPLTNLRSLRRSLVLAERASGPFPRRLRRRLGPHHFPCPERTEIKAHARFDGLGFGGLRSIRGVLLLATY